jgi:hypothetical protein
MRALAVVLLLAVALPGLVSADVLNRSQVVLSKPGDPVEVAGLHSRVIAFYEPRGERLKLTLLIGGAGLGNDLLRAGFTLLDGQSHHIRTSGQGGSGEEFSFRREGDAVYVAFQMTGDIPLAARRSVDPDPVVESVAAAIASAN